MIESYFLFNMFLFLRQVLFQHRQALIEQLKVTEDPALVLHLTSVLLFQFSTHCMLHAPGRSVPQIINFLSGKIPEVFFPSFLRGNYLFFYYMDALSVFCLFECLSEFRLSNTSLEIYFCITNSLCPRMGECFLKNYNFNYRSACLL